MGALISYYLYYDVLGNVSKTKNHYYTLYIYLENNISESIKSMYYTNANKHNLIVDEYLSSINSTNEDSNNNEDKGIEYCYDSGFDLISPSDYSNSKSLNSTSNMIMLDHNIKCAMKYQNRFVGYYLYSRSSTPIKTPLRLANNVGIIDSGYRGNIKACFDLNKNHEYYEDFKIESGNRYVQITPPDIGKPMKIVLVDNLRDLGNNTYRGTGGFGSTN
jgi:dUTP pyrophosphatase